MSQTRDKHCNGCGWAGYTDSSICTKCGRELEDDQTIRRRIKMTVKGLIRKEHPCDSPCKCSQCGKMYYIPHTVNGQWVECPHCGKKRQKGDIRDESN